MRLAFDIGGTFTDFVLHDPSTDTMKLWKVPSSSGEPANAVIKAIGELLGEGTVSADAIEATLHATTVATNAVLERSGARVALLTTRGFRDVALLGRQKRPDTNDMNLVKQRPLLERADIFEVTERIEVDGKIHTALHEQDLEAVFTAIRKGSYDAVAVMFLHAYANPIHEQEVRNRLTAELPDLLISISSEVSPKYREYERVTTTIANAYVQPIVQRYLDRLDAAFKDKGLLPELEIMQSNGGLVSPIVARKYPVRIVESGPAAGVLMCGQVGREEKIDHLLTFDMGGTTAKMGAIDHGEPQIVPTFEVDTIKFRKGSGLPLNISAIELLEIGAGGGSIANLRMGLIEVGPQSAGALPGPICYGNGGTLPTITDANLILGYLDPNFFNGGAMVLDIDSAREGIKKHIGDHISLDTANAAWGIHSMANANMERAMRMVSIERGRDPRKHAMIAFGGAGPLHAARLARSLGVPRVLIPYGAGVGSAMGLLTADRKLDNSLTAILSLKKENLSRIAEVFDSLAARLSEELNYMNTDSNTVSWHRSCSMRYEGQGYELRVDLPDGPIDTNFLEQVKTEFEDVYSSNYGYKDSDAAIEGIDWHLTATIANTKPTKLGSRASTSKGEAERTKREAFFPEAGGYVLTPVIDRYKILPGMEFSGPVLVEERECTTVVLPGDIATVTTSGHLNIEINVNKHKEAVE